MPDRRCSSVLSFFVFFRFVFFSVLILRLSGIIASLLEEGGEIADFDGGRDTLLFHLPVSMTHCRGNAHAAMARTSPSPLRATPFSPKTGTPSSLRDTPSNRGNYLSGQASEISDIKKQMLLSVDIDFNICYFFIYNQP